MQDSANSVTIDEAIGMNLRHLREGQDLTLEEAAGVLTILTAGEPWSLWKLRRWETGGHAFTMDDLYLLCGLYGVNLIGLLKPHQTDPKNPDYTPPESIQMGAETVPVERYVMDLFIDPSGRFTDRARDIAARKQAGTWHLEVALDDVDETWGDKGEIGEFVSTLARIHNIIALLEAERDGIETTEDAAAYRELAELVREWWEAVNKDTSTSRAPTRVKR